MHGAVTVHEVADQRTIDDLRQCRIEWGSRWRAGGRPRQEDFENAYYVRDRYKPTCMRVQGEGAELSRMVCRNPEK